MATITDTRAKNIKPTESAIPHGGITGLALHPSSTKGRGKWVLRYVSPVTGKRRNAGLGTYPEVGIAEVGKQAAAMRTALAEGKDPLEEKAKVQKAPKVPTFKDAAETLHRDLLPGWKNPKHGQQWLNTLEQYVFPKMGHKLLPDIQPGDVAEVLKPIWLTKAETASRVKQRIHAVMAWGWAHGHCQSNPVDVVTHLLAQQPGKALRTQHHPAMPWRDIPTFVQQHLRTGNRPEVSRTLLEFVILTACRSGDLRHIYQAATAEEAELRLGEFEAKWDLDYLPIGQSWRRNWSRLTPFFDYPAEIRKVIYTTNAIESVNMGLRKLSKNRGSFPSDEALTKLFYLALRNISQKWTMPIRDWKAALTRFTIQFGDRISVN